MSWHTEYMLQYKVSVCCGVNSLTVLEIIQHSVPSTVCVSVGGTVFFICSARVAQLFSFFLTICKLNLITTCVADNSFYSEIRPHLFRATAFMIPWYHVIMNPYYSNHWWQFKICVGCYLKCLSHAVMWLCKRIYNDCIEKSANSAI